MEDFDPLRSGSITKSQFRRGLSLMGLSKLGWHDLTDGQHQMLCDCYQDPSKVDNVLYAQFIKDVESGMWFCLVVSKFVCICWVLGVFFCVYVFFVYPFMYSFFFNVIYCVVLSSCLRGLV